MFMTANTRIIAIANQKGGVGKTTTALSLSAALRSMGREVLLVDLDQQANATTAYGAEMEGVANAYAILCRETPDAALAVQATDKGDIIAGHPDLKEVEARMASAVCRESILRNALRGVVASGRYDYVVIDCPPSLGVVTVNALVAATDLIVPVLVDSYSIDGVEGVDDLLGGDLAPLTSGLARKGLVVCQREAGQRLTADFDRQLPQVAGRFGMLVMGPDHAKEGAGFPSRGIRRCVRAREAQWADGSILDYAPGCTTAEDYMALAREVDAMAG